MSAQVQPSQHPINLPRARATAEKWLNRYAEVTAELDAQRTARKPLEEELVQLRGKLQAWSDEPANATAFTDSQLVAFEKGSFGYRNGVEKIEFNLENEMTDKERTAAVVAALRRYHADGVKETFDEKQVLKAWPVLPKFRDALKGIIKGVKRESGFVITLKK